MTKCKCGYKLVWNPKKVAYVCEICGVRPILCTCGVLE